MNDTQALEHQLLRQAQQADDPGAAYDAFEQLHALLEPKIRRFVQRLIGMGDVVDDVVQLTFIALYRNLARVDPVETLRPYLFRIARNRCYDELRSQGRYEDVTLEDEAEYRVMVSFTPQEAEPEDAAHWLLLHLEVRRAIDALPELQRQTLILFSEENLSYEEIALAMDASLGTVKSRLFHARKTLRRLLSPQVLQAVESALGVADGESESSNSGKPAGSSTAAERSPTAPPDPASASTGPHRAVDGAEDVRTRRSAGRTGAGTQAAHFDS